MSDNNKIACFDADIIIKTSRNNKELLENVVDIFDKCYLHKCVYEEINWPQKTIKLLNKLIKKNKINLITDENLYDELEIKKLFLDSLQQVCEIFGLEYENIYSNHNNIVNNKGKFINKLYKSDKCIKENVGEVRTLLMIILLREIEKDKINYFISDDRRARNVIVFNYGKTLTENKIYGLSLLSSFYMLKKEGLTKKEAMKFVSNFYSKQTKIFYEENRMEKMNNTEIIEKIYEDKLKLLRNGDFLLQE